MKEKPGILFAASEAVPFLKTGGLADVAGSLPKALCAAGADCRVITPKYGNIPACYREKMTHVTDFYLNLGWRNVYCGIEELKQDGITWYFVDNEYYFKRDGAYGYFDDGERFAFFAKAICECIPHLPDFCCDILHCNDWHTALAPVFLREFYRDVPACANIKTVLTVHNLKFQGQMSDFMLGDVLGLSGIRAAADQLRSDRASINFMKGGLSYADRITTVSPTYAGEVQSGFYGEHLDDLFRRRESILRGILNGIDEVSYDPAADKALAAHYSAKDRSGKAACKAALQKELGLEENPDLPLIVMITRLTEQKGLDLLRHVIGELLSQPLQLAVLGTGEKCYEDMLKHEAWCHPGKMAACVTFDEKLSRRMYAGADLFLMPSLFEPCGLSQMIAMRYGALPIVRETGGLRDSVVPYNQFTGEGTGFSFANYNAHEMMFTLFAAVDLYRSDRAAFDKLVQNAMSADFSWRKAAGDYMALYAELCPERFAKAAPAEPEKKAEPAKAVPAEKTPVRKPAAKAAAKPTEKTAKTAPKKAAPVKAEKPVEKQVKPSPVKTEEKPAVTAAKPAVKPAEKPAAKAVEKVAAKPAEKPAVTAAKPTTKTAAPIAKPAEKAAKAAPKKAATKKTVKK